MAVHLRHRREDALDVRRRLDDDPHDRDRFVGEMEGGIVDPEEPGRGLHPSHQLEAARHLIDEGVRSRADAHTGHGPRRELREARVLDEGRRQADRARAVAKGLEVADRPTLHDDLLLSFRPPVGEPLAMVRPRLERRHDRGVSDLHREFAARQLEVRAHRDHELVVHALAPSVQLRRPFLFELLQLRLDRLEFHPGAVSDLFVMRTGTGRLHPHSTFRVLDRPAQALPLLRQLLELQPDAMVPLLLRQEFAGPRFRDPREGRMHLRHPRVRAAPPAEREEGEREADQSARDVRRDNVAEIGRLVDAEGVQEERPEDGHRDREDEAEREAVQTVVLPVQLPLAGIQGVDEEVSGEEEEEDEGPDHARRRGDGAEDIVRQRDVTSRSLFEGCAADDSRRERLRPGHAASFGGAMKTDRGRVKTYVRSLDDILEGGLPAGFVVLLNGAPGTMKSSFAFSILYHNALREGRKSAYFTLEQGKGLTLEHMASLGMTDPAANANITTLDMANIRKNLNYLQGRDTWLDLFKMYCTNAMKADSHAVLVVDSLDVLEAMAKMEDRRSELYFLFEWLRGLGPLILLISEKPLGSGSGVHAPEEAYLADGIIRFEMHPTADLFVQRRLRGLVRTAASGRQALQLARAHPFDVLVIGSKLRDSTGVEVVKLLAERFPTIPKIFVVPPDGEEAALQALKSGAMSYIVKTPRYTELLPAIVMEIVAEGKARKQLAESEQTQAKAVTEKRSVEERLSQSENRLRLILQQAPVLLWSTDGDLHVTSAMGGGFRTLDTSRSQERGLTLFDYFSVRDEDLEPIASHRRALGGERVATQIEWQGRTYDVHIEPLRSPEGANIGTLGVAFDVSERTPTEETLRRSEERFQLLGRATSDVVWDWDLQTDGLWANENFSKVFGYPAEEIEPTGAWWTDHLHPEDRERVVTSIDEVVRGGGSVWTSEYRFRRRDGTHATVVDRGYVLHDSAGHPVRVIGSAMDVTKRRETEAIQSAI